MSLIAPRNEGEAKFQYCNYGYDKSIYTSFKDCMNRYGTNEKPLTNTQKWGWVIGLTLGAWALIYLVNKKK